MNEEMLITTTEMVPGHDYEILGEVFGVTTQSKKCVFRFWRWTEKYGWR